MTAVRVHYFGGLDASVYDEVSRPAPGESFFEPPGSMHRISDEDGKLLAVFIADDGAQLTRFDP
jgi:hypothetical protein